MTQHKKIIAFIKVVRGSFPDSPLVYRCGGCYGFYQILKHVFPSATAYFSNKKETHILTKIGGRFYEIGGEEQRSIESVKLTPRDHEKWEGIASSQRLEWMIRKYHSDIGTFKIPPEEKD